MMRKLLPFFDFYDFLLLLEPFLLTLTKRDFLAWNEIFSLLWIREKSLELKGVSVIWAFKLCDWVTLFVMPSHRVIRNIFTPFWNGQLPPPPLPKRDRIQDFVGHEMLMPDIPSAHKLLPTSKNSGNKAYTMHTIGDLNEWKRRKRFEFLF